MSINDFLFTADKHRVVAADGSKAYEVLKSLGVCTLPVHIRAEGLVAVDIETGIAQTAKSLVAIEYLGNTW